MTQTHAHTHPVRGRRGLKPQYRFSLGTTPSSAVEGGAPLHNALPCEAPSYLYFLYLSTRVRFTDFSNASTWYFASFFILLLKYQGARNFFCCRTIIINYSPLFHHSDAFYLSAMVADLSFAFLITDRCFCRTSCFISIILDVNMLSLILISVLAYLSSSPCKQVLKMTINNNFR